MGINQTTEQYEELFFALLNSSSNPVFITDGFKLLHYNQQFSNLFNTPQLQNLETGEVSIINIFENVHSDFSDKWLNTQEELSVTITDSIISKEHTFILKVNQIDNEIYLIYLQNITKSLEYESNLLKMLYEDALTRLPNRSKLIEQLQNQELNETSMCLIDIRSFKEINDFYGHKTGDYILSEIAEILFHETTHDETLFLYKFPADVYCIVNCGYDKELFETTIKHLIDTIEKTVFFHNNHEINARVTAGLSFSTKNNKLITADLALQAAKKDKKDYVIFYEELDNLQEYENNMKWTKKVKNALKEDNIMVVYQPLINNKNMQAEKYECLVRLKDGDKIVSPYFFLDISKKSNQYSQITKTVIKKACKAFSKLEHEFSVNISYEDIEDPEFYNFIEDVVTRNQVENRIVFEILEDENVKNYDILIEFVDKIKLLGCKVAIDDFGSGYSNFEHLLKMNIDYLKIDASLIKNIANDESSYKITKTIIEFAQSLELKTIAEFVENKEIFDIVKELDCDYSQGYYFAPPLNEPAYSCEVNNE